MRNMKAGALLGAIVALTLGGGAAAFNQDDLVFRTAGWFQGIATISQGQITCQIPNTASAITDGAFATGLWNTHGVQMLFFPDPNNPFGDPCGGWMQFRNNLLVEDLLVDHVDLNYKIANARRFKRFGVPMRNGFPTACKGFRRTTIFASGLIPPVEAGTSTVTGSGTVNVAFLQVLPMVGADVIECLREQFTSLPTSVFEAFPLIITAQAVGISDAGDTYRSNAVRYTLNLRHTCGNGRVDDGEECDPNALGNTCVGKCQNGTCTQNSNVGCATDADCIGSCVPQGNPEECTCLY
ncbi:MAG TPA: hypothetical protein VKW76_04770 [Candidatus Binatia bacterium]|nr:hypothetical protein [Candidatus Binatia bacterium]